MARNTKRKGSKKKGGKFSAPLSGTDRLVTVTGKTLLQIAVPLPNDVITFPLATANDTALVSLLGDRVQAFSNVFQEFRFNRVVLKIHPATQTGGVRADQLVAYSKVLLSVSSVPLVDLYELDCSRFLSFEITVPQTLAIGPSVLRSGLRQWYSCQGGTAIDLVDLCNGALYFSADGTDVTFTVEMSYSISFRGDTSPSLVTPVPLPLSPPIPKPTFWSGVSKGVTRFSR